MELTAEQEAIVLAAAWQMIDGMVNFEMFMKFNIPASDTNLMFNTMTHQRLFNVLLCDFLSKPNQFRGTLPFGLPECPKTPRGSDRTMLYYLRLVCEGSKLGTDPSVIDGPRSAFADWLDATAEIPEVWLPSINTQLDIKITRIQFLKICGNIGKHSLTRLQGDVRDIQNILADNGCEVDEGQVYMLLPEFYQWFHDHLFNHHSSTIAEFLNNIRWSFYCYLLPEFQRSFERTGEFAYKFDVPSVITSELGRAMYWDLMNMVRSPPWFPRFTVTRFLKQRY